MIDPMAHLKLFLERSRGVRWVKVYEVGGRVFINTHWKEGKNVRETQHFAPSFQEALALWSDATDLSETLTKESTEQKSKP